MQTLRHLEDKLGLVPARMLPLLSRVDEGRGREDLYREQRPAILERLIQVARIQSAEASNAIEGVTAPPRRPRELMAERTAPRNRSEAEIAGYRAVLDLVHQSARHMPFTSNMVLHLHRDLYRFTAEPGGRWKPTDNHIEERRRDGTMSAVFRTVPFAETPGAMEEASPPGAYVLDFLCIHPFRDGNGRMARPPGHHRGHVRGARGAGRRAGRQGAKVEAIEQFVRAVPEGAEFRVADVRRNAAGAGDSYISKVLARLRDEGLIAPRGRGRAARWQRLHTPPPRPR